MIRLRCPKCTRETMSPSEIRKMYYRARAGEERTKEEKSNNHKGFTP